MTRFIFKAYKKCVELFTLPIQVAYFFKPVVGKEYQFGFQKKIRLIWLFQKNNAAILSASDWLEHLQIAARILQNPPEVNGHVAEWGSYKRGSAANPSLVCAA